MKRQMFGSGVLAALTLAASACTLTLDTTECVTTADCERYNTAETTYTCDGPTQTCVEQAAEVECRLNSDCSVGESCEGGVCVTDPVTPDAGPTDTGEPDAGEPDAGDAGGDDVERISGSLTGMVMWSKDKTYVLEGIVYVEAQATLTITAGTVIKGEPGSALIVRKGGRLRATGSAREPVVFTSAQPEGQRLPGDWGGVAMLGNAPANQINPILEGVEETDKVVYGGSEPSWSCGKLEYVRIEFAGFALDRNSELNSLTLAGCGSGTIIDYVQTHYGTDDGVEIFGGNVDIQHVVISRSQDDSLDIDRGWTGRAQFVAIQQDSGVDADNGIEADNWEDSKDAEPRTSPQIYNITIIGPTSGSKPKGMTFKHGVAGTISNAIVMGHPNEVVDVQGTETAQQATSGALTIQNSMFFDMGSDGQTYFPNEPVGESSDDDDGLDEEAIFTAAENANVLGRSPELADPFNLTAPDFSPTLASAVAGGASPPSDSFFDDTATYMGAFDPAGANWMDGWTSFPEN